MGGDSPQPAELIQNASYLQHSENSSATPHHHPKQKHIREYPATPSLSLDIGTPLTEAWEMALHGVTTPQSGLPAPTEHEVQADICADGAVGSSPSGPITMERTDSSRPLKKEKRTSILGSFFYTSKSAKGLSVDNTDGSLENRIQPETPRKLLGRFSLPPSPRSAINLSWGSTSRGIPSSERMPRTRDCSGSTSRPQSTLSVLTRRLSDTSHNTLNNRERSGEAASVSEPMKSEHPSEGRKRLQSSTTVHADNSSNTLRASQSARRHQGTLVGTPGGTIYGLGELGQHSMPVPLFRHSVSIDEIEGVVVGSSANSSEKPNSGGKDAPRLPKAFSEQESATYSPKLDISPDFLDSKDSFFTESSVTRTASTSTAPTSAVPSSHPDSTRSPHTGPHLSRPVEDDASPAADTSSSESPKRPGIQRSRAFRQRRKDKLFDAFSPEEQIALEDLINAEAARRCRQVLIEIEDDTVFEKAMGQALRNQFGCQPHARETMPSGLERHQDQSDIPKDAIKPSFLVREILRGERSYIHHLEHGVMVSGNF